MINKSAEKKSSIKIIQSSSSLVKISPNKKYEKVNSKYKDEFRKVSESGSNKHSLESRSKSRPNKNSKGAGVKLFQAKNIYHGRLSDIGDEQHDANKIKTDSQSNKHKISNEANQK